MSRLDEVNEPQEPQHVEAHAQTAQAFAVAFAPGVSIGYGPDRPWFEKWNEALDAYEKLDGAYAGTLKLPGSDDYKRLVPHFCDACFEVRDWLKRGPATYDERVS